MASYYNEFCPTAAAWVRQLIADKQIPYGHVDDRSITEVEPSDLRGFTQAHWFAGVSGWSLALKLAGWPDDRPVWTASLPCQPFSSAGKQAGTDDERHLWPVFQRLVSECRPPVLIGEQVSSKIAREKWFPGVCLDLQAMGYPVTALDLCAPCAGEDGEGRLVRGDQETWERIVIGAPHIRQRLYWVAYRGVEHSEHSEHSEDHGQLREGSLRETQGRRSDESGSGSCESTNSRMADTELRGRERIQEQRSTSILGAVDGETEPFIATGAHSATSDRTTDHRMAQPRNVGAGSQPRQTCGLGGQPVDTGAEGLRQDHGTACPSGSDSRGAGCDANLRMDDPHNHEYDSHERGDGEADSLPRVDGSPVCAGEFGGTGISDGWKRVSFAADCLGGGDDEPGDECSICGLTYAEDCECPGPIQDGYDYDERDGVLYARWMGDTRSEGSQGLAGNVGDGSEPGRQHPQQARPAGATSWTDSAEADQRMAHAVSERRRSGSAGVEDAADARSSGEAHRPRRTGFWSDFDLIPCRDGKARRTQRGSAPLVAGLPRGVVPSCDPGAPGYANETSEARVMRLKGYGNSIVAPLAAMFIEICMEVIPHE